MPVVHVLPSSSLMNPYRSCGHPIAYEEELWKRLDEALERSLTDPTWAWGTAWQLVKDAKGYPELEQAAVGLMHALRPLPPDWDLP